MCHALCLANIANLCCFLEEENKAENRSVTHQ